MIDMSRVLDRARPVAPTLVVVTAVLAIGAASSSQEVELPSLSEVASAFGFTPKQVKEMLAGETVFGKLESVSDTELAQSAGVFSKRTVDWHLAEAMEFDSRSNRSDRLHQAHK